MSDDGADTLEPFDKRSTADRFGAKAADYLTSETHRRGDDIERLASWCAGAHRALDVATGAGHAAGALRRHGVETVVAMDSAPEMVATATAAYDSEGVVGDAERLPFSDDAFDAVTCRIAAHHFPDSESFVAEVGRVLRSGGVFAFEDNVAPPEWELATFIDRVERRRDPSHVGLDTPKTWGRRFESHGFTVETVAAVTRRLDFDAWCQRMAVSDVTKRTLQTAFNEAPPGAVSRFALVFEDGDIDSFVVPKRLFRLRK